MKDFMKIVNSDNSLVFVNLANVDLILFSDAKLDRKELEIKLVEIRFSASEIIIDSRDDFFKDNIETLISWGFRPPIEWGFSNSI